MSHKVQARCDAPTCSHVDYEMYVHTSRGGVPGKGAQAGDCPECGQGTMVVEDVLEGDTPGTADDDEQDGIIY